jgi:hypothetical protein
MPYTLIMPSRRRFPIVVSVVVTAGLMCVVGAVALHLHAARYRAHLEAKLSDQLGMDVHIGAIRVLALEGRHLVDVHAYLRGRHQEVFSCAEAIWATDTSRGPGARTLELRNGWLLVGAARWTQDEYERMLAGGLGHDFTTIELGTVRLRGIDLRFHHPAMILTAESTSGVVEFDQTGEGRASLRCLRLNGVDVTEPVHLMFRFTPGEHLVFHEMSLTVPQIPVDALGVGGLLEGSLSHGRFRGTIAYHRLDEGESVEISGSLDDADLLEFTGRLPDGPYHGKIDVELDKAMLRDGRLCALDARGHVRDVRLREVLPGLVSPSSDGRLVLDVEHLKWREDRVVELAGSGTCEALSLDALSALWGEGIVTGSVAIDLPSVEIEDDALRHAELTIVAEPPSDGPGLLAGDIVARAAKQWFNVDLGGVFPDVIEYTQLGVRFLVQDGRLHVFGTHGPDGRTILSIKLFGRPLGVLRQPERTFPVPDVLGGLRRRADQVAPDEVRAWWEHLRLRDETSQQPASPHT